MVCLRTKRRFQYSHFAFDVGKTLSTVNLISTQKLSDWQMHHHLLLYFKALFLVLLRTHCFNHRDGFLWLPRGSSLRILKFEFKWYAKDIPFRE